MLLSSLSDNKQFIDLDILKGAKTTDAERIKLAHCGPDVKERLLTV